MFVIFVCAFQNIDELQVKLINTARWTFHGGHSKMRQKYNWTIFWYYYSAQMSKSHIITKSTKVKRKGKRICGQWQEGFTAWLEPSVLRKYFLSLSSCIVLEFYSFCKQGLDILIVWRCSWWSFKARNRLLRQSGKNNCCVWLFQLTERWRTLADYTLESLILADCTLESLIVRPQLRVSWI